MQTDTEAHRLGRFAEDKAAEYLLSLGWRVLSRNVRNQYGELDITAFDTENIPEELVIVEVRCRTIGKMQSPFDSIGPRKIRTLMRASQDYVDNLGWQGFWRIDVIGITADKKTPNHDLINWELEHIKDITS